MNTIIDSPIVENIKQIILEKSLEQSSITQFFSDILNGKKIVMATDIPIIAKILEVTPNELYQKGGEDYE